MFAIGMTLFLIGFSIFGYSNTNSKLEDLGFYLSCFGAGEMLASLIILAWKYLP